MHLKWYSRLCTKMAPRAMFYYSQFPSHLNMRFARPRMHAYYAPHGLLACSISLWPTLEDCSLSPRFYFSARSLDMECWMAYNSYAGANHIALGKGTGNDSGKDLSVSVTGDESAARSWRSQV